MADAAASATTAPARRRSSWRRKATSSNLIRCWHAVSQATNPATRARAVAEWDRPRCAHPRRQQGGAMRVLIVGAGIGGLTAALALAPGRLRRPRLRAGQRPARGRRGGRDRPQRRQGPAPAGARRGAPRRRRRLRTRWTRATGRPARSWAGCRSPRRPWPAGARPSTTCTARTSTMRCAPPWATSTSPSAPAALPSSSTTAA